MKITGKIAVGVSGWLDGVVAEPGDQGEYLVVWETPESGDPANLVPYVYLDHHGSHATEASELHHAIASRHWIVIGLRVKEKEVKLAYTCGGELILPCGVIHAADPLILSAISALGAELAYPEPDRTFCDPALIRERGQ